MPVLVWISSQGDEDQTTELKSFGGTGVFTVALHQALFGDRIDAAVHSLKDLPAQEEEGVLLACVPVREDPRDVLISKGDVPLEKLPKGAKVGTGSPRRAAQLLRARPDLEVHSIRGNVDTRLTYVSDGRLDGVMLALAGLRRLGRDAVVSEVLDPEVCLPAAGQGALGITVRHGDAAAEAAVATQADVKTAACVAAERSALHALEAGCHAPVGALATVEDGRVRLFVRVVSLDGTQTIEHAEMGPLSRAAEVGATAAKALLERGAGPIIENA
jgi:hydroxymethylbilane synthase